MGGCSSICSSPPIQPNPDVIDTSHFDLLKVVGKGGFGKVNAVTRRWDGKLMAMKRMAKCQVIKKESHIRMVWTERNIMAKLSSDAQSNPFLVTLQHAFQDEKELFFVMDFMQGGDLRFHLNRRGALNEREARFYAAEMVLALESMHRQKIIHRDFKLDNLLLDSSGHLRLSDFGLSVQLEEKWNYVMRGNAGTAAYLAPEVWSGQPYGVSADVWSFGVSLYEILHGRRPYRRWTTDPNRNPIARMKLSSSLTPPCRSFLRSLLEVDPSRRIGCGPSGWTEIKLHPFFAKVDWAAVAQKIQRPPIRPDPRTANCSNQADLADQLLDKRPTDISPSSQKYFEGFEYNVDVATWRRNEEAGQQQAERIEEERTRLKATATQQLVAQNSNKNGMPNQSAEETLVVSPLSETSPKSDDDLTEQQAEQVMSERNGAVAAAVASAAATVSPVGGHVACPAESGALVPFMTATAVAAAATAVAASPSAAIETSPVSSLPPASSPAVCAPPPPPHAHAWAPTEQHHQHHSTFAVVDVGSGIIINSGGQNSRQLSDRADSKSSDISVTLPSHLANTQAYHPHYHRQPHVAAPIASATSDAIAAPSPSSTGPGRAAPGGQQLRLLGAGLRGGPHAHAHAHLQQQQQQQNNGQQRRRTPPPGPMVIESINPHALATLQQIQQHRLQQQHVLKTSLTSSGIYVPSNDEPNAPEMSCTVALGPDLGLGPAPAPAILPGVTIQNGRAVAYAATNPAPAPTPNDTTNADIVSPPHPHAPPSRHLNTYMSAASDAQPPISPHCISHGLVLHNSFSLSTAQDETVMSPSKQIHPNTSLGLLLTANHGPAAAATLIMSNETTGTSPLQKQQSPTGSTPTQVSCSPPPSTVTPGIDLASPARYRSPELEAEPETEVEVELELEVETEPITPALDHPHAVPSARPSIHQQSADGDPCTLISSATDASQANITQFPTPPTHTHTHTHLTTTGAASRTRAVATPVLHPPLSLSTSTSPEPSDLLPSPLIHEHSASQTSASFSIQRHTSDGDHDHTTLVHHPAVVSAIPSASAALGTSGAMMSSWAATNKSAPIHATLTPSVPSSTGTHVNVPTASHHPSASTFASASSTASVAPFPSPNTPEPHGTYACLPHDDGESSSAHTAHTVVAVGCAAAST